GYEARVVIGGGGWVGLGNDHLEQVHRGAEERPLLVHFAKLAQLPCLLGVLQRGAHAEPRRQTEAVLRPSENPRNGSQRLQSAGLATTCRTTADVERTQFLLGRRRTEVFDEPIPVAHDGAVLLERHLRQRVDALTPLGLGTRRWVERR